MTQAQDNPADTDTSAVADLRDYLDAAFGDASGRVHIAAGVGPHFDGSGKYDHDELALTMMSALQGGLLMAQTTRSARPLEPALNMALGHIAGYRRSPMQEPPR